MSWVDRILERARASWLGGEARGFRRAWWFREVAW